MLKADASSVLIGRTGGLVDGRMDVFQGSQKHRSGISKRVNQQPRARSD